MDNLFNQIYTTNYNLILTTTLAQFITFLPKLVLALVILLIARIAASSLQNLTARVFHRLAFSQIIKSLNLDIVINRSFDDHLSHLGGLIIKYATLYLGLILALQTLDLNQLAQVLTQILYLFPRLLSAALVLFIGIIIAGFVESVIKKAVSSVDPATARLAGKTASYVVVSFFSLMSLAELGLATIFINTLFIGLVATCTLAFGLALGLGAKDLVRDVLASWYQHRTQLTKPKNKK